MLCAGCGGGKSRPGQPGPVFDEAAVGIPFPQTVAGPEPRRSSDLIVTPEYALIGRVVRYNDAGRFVVVDFPLGRTPAAEQRMFVYRRGLKVGEVKINSWQRENLMVADLVVGEAAEGDEIKNK
jgi:hypothetical protein